MMTGLVTLGSQPGTAAQLPVAIDYPAALALRQMALVQDELPKYLLAPEVSALLHYARSAPKDVAGHPLEYRSAH